MLLFFQDGGKIQTMMVFGKPLRACEILRIWSQHHGIEQFWAEYACGILHDLKTDLKLSSMSLEGPRCVCKLRCKSDELPFNTAG